MSLLTVFTPAYNRAYCLHNLYNSLLNQTDQNFVWLIVDDGSTDNTRELVQSWQNEGKLSINYVFKENGGMHTAHNVAYKMIKTPLNVCIDSDDYMPIDAIKNILNKWHEIKEDDSIAGMVGLDEDVNKKLIGTEFPPNLKRTKLGDLYHKYGVKGDKKLVYKSKITAAYPRYPEFEKEKLVPLDSLYMLIDRDYDIIPYNERWCTVDYQVDGSSGTIIKQYFQSPNGFRTARVIAMKYGATFKYRAKNTIHYVVSSLILKDALFIAKSPKPMLTCLLFPFGVTTYLYLKSKVSK